MTQIKPEPPLLAGSLSTRRRTVAGVIGQARLLGLAPHATAAVLRDAGLPGRAGEDPDFPITMDQELRALDHCLRALPLARRSIPLFALETFDAVGINHYGMLGLAMQHAPTVLEALRTLLAFPELAWGHSRIVGRFEDDAFVLAFDPGVELAESLDPAALRAYCVTTDLVSVRRMIADLGLPERQAPLLKLPFPEPAGAAAVLAAFPCPVHFDAEAAEIRYRREIVAAPPALASDLPYRRYRRLAENFAHLLAEEVEISEQVRRLLWACTPAPNREQVADMLGTSPRTLARHLRRAGTSFGALQRSVRLERASHFLQRGSLPVAEIAERLGYSDAAAFTRAFRAWTGEAPSRWRRAHRDPI